MEEEVGYGNLLEKMHRKEQRISAMASGSHTWEQMGRVRGMENSAN